MQEFCPAVSVGKIEVDILPHFLFLEQKEHNHKKKKKKRQYKVNLKVHFLR